MWPVAESRSRAIVVECGTGVLRVVRHFLPADGAVWTTVAHRLWSDVGRAVPFYVPVIGASRFFRRSLPTLTLVVPRTAACSTVGSEVGGVIDRADSVERWYSGAPNRV